MGAVPERLATLSRPDKWQLSCGDGWLWAPPFPLFLHAPGFWDEARIFYHPLEPLFSIALIDAHGRRVELRQTGRQWQPGKLVCTYALANGEELVETKTVEPGGCFRSRWTPCGPTWRDLGEALVVYTVQPGPDVGSAEFDNARQTLNWQRTLRDRREVDLDVTASLRLSSTATELLLTASARRSEAFANQPIWSITPFAEDWNGTLDDRVALEGIDASGSVYLAAAVRLAELGDHDLTIDLTVTPTPTTPTSPSSPSSTPGVSRRRNAEELWEAHFAAFPTFTCSDPYLTRYYDYRLYGLFLNRYAGGCGNVAHPAIAEGIGYFHVPISYSAPCHMFEMRWAELPIEESAAHGSLLNFLEHQKDDGSLHGRLYTNHLVGTDFYHANWGDALLAVQAVAPNEAFLERCYAGLSRYARWLDESRDRERSGMYDVVNHFETGQEYMSRYQAVNPRADLAGWKDETKLKAIDVTVYAYQLQRALEQIAAHLGHDAEATSWRGVAERTGAAILTRMWDPGIGMFSDVDPRSGERTGVKAAVCFYPLLTDLLEDAHVEALLSHLTNPEEFWTAFPVPSSSLDDPLFNAEAMWKGKRHICPWNGRTWPMTNSHIVDGLIRQWRRRPLHEFGEAVTTAPSPRYRCGEIAGDLLSRFVRMMFHDGDLERPNCFEHYNPHTGRACTYRGIDDYQHSYVLDLIIRGVAGICPPRELGGSVVVDPLPMAMDSLLLRGGRVGGRTYDIERHGRRIVVTVNGDSHETMHAPLSAL
jgi:Mannosylglycerate hydrolase MGH1-like glycoside hydrolase domain